MVLRKLMGIFAITLLIGAASLATAGVPDLALSMSSRAYAGPETAVVHNLPNGGGDAFTAAAAFGVVGAVDATITLHLVDGAGADIPNFPFEDMWLANAATFVPCTGGSTADGNTDASGLTQWQNPLLAGGSGDVLTTIMISGAALTSSAGEAVWFNSADITGDGNVNLTDVSPFAADFFGAYNFRSDLVYDQAVNLTDVIRLAGSLGSNCP